MRLAFKFCSGFRPTGEVEIAVDSVMGLNALVARGLSLGTKVSSSAPLLPRLFAGQGGGASVVPKQMALAVDVEMVPILKQPPANSSNPSRHLPQLSPVDEHVPMKGSTADSPVHPVQAAAHALMVENLSNERYVVISVRDSGIGIAKDKLSLLWRSFQQLDASIQRRYGGTGEDAR